MMKHLTLFGLLFMASLFIQAGVVERTYTFESPEILQKGEFQYLQQSGLMNAAKPGEPLLLYQDVKLLLPPGQEAKSISFSFGQEMQIPGDYYLFPYQPAIPLSFTEPSGFVLNQNIYSANMSYPEVPNGELITQKMNGYAVALSSFTPYRYNPSTGQLSYYASVTISIETENDPKAIEVLKNLKTRATDQLSRFVQNPEMAKHYPQNTNKGDEYQLLIITTSQYENEFDQLRQNYLEKGLISELATVEDIYSSMSGQDQQEKIRNYIIQEYQDNSIEFVLLGGDVEYVPYRGLYCYVQSGSGYESNDIPADLYYAGLDGTWNDDNDNNWGEPGEDDLLPEIGIARYSFSNSTELGNMLNKSLSYQNDPVLGELTTTTFAGEWLYSSPETWGSDYLELLIGYQNENGYETWGIPEDYTYHKLYEENQSWGANDLMAEVNSGRQYVHHVGHANSTYVAYMYNSDITNSNFSGANGVDHNYTIFHSHGCICGAFDDSDCIMEKMHSIENFAVAVVGNSRYGWFNEGQTEGPAAHLHREMVDALYHEGLYRIGEAFKESKIQTAPWVTAPGQWEEGALRWNFYDINIFGDPSLPLWTDEPMDISASYQNAIPIGVTSTSVTITSGGSPVENLTCAIIKDGELYGVGYTDASGTAQIDFDPVFTEVGDAELFVSGSNCLTQDFPVSIIPNTGAYVVYSQYTIDDNLGNNNGVVDFGESILLDVEIENVGATVADNLQINLTTADSYINITDGLESLASLPGNASELLEGAFAFDVDTDIPDQHQVLFMLEVIGDETWISEFSMSVNAPELVIGGIVIDDSQSGNNNGMLDPGETVDIKFETSNVGHCDSEDALGALSSSSSYLTLNTSTSSLGSLAQGQTAMAEFSVTIDGSAPIGSSVDLLYQITSGDYWAQQNFNLTVGLIVEDFETGDFSAYGWEFGGNADWTITNQNPYEGTYSAKSGSINDQQESELSITMNVLNDDEISFFRRVSSEENYDYLRFYIDNTMMDEWAGEELWSEVSFNVTAGEHTFTWAYEKDYSVSSGDDCAWIDYIVFPGSTNGSVLSVNATANPDEICEGESAQLYANASGGTGNYTYSWTPNTGLDDPNSATPVASPATSTTYTVEVSDGSETLTSDIYITVYETPETPVVSHEGDHVSSSASEGNQWYNTSGLIEGATGQTYYPEISDYYYVIVTNNSGCSSEQSNTVYFMLTGVTDREEQSINIYPNPVKNNFMLDISIAGNSDILIELYNHLGQKAGVLKQVRNQAAGVYSYSFNRNGLGKGLYFLHIETEAGILIKKLVFID